jgi:hypothetical protein
MRKRYLCASVQFISLLFILTVSAVKAQEDSQITEAYEDYTEAQREVAYLHLNKSTYIKGEDIGFTAYILNKSDKMPSLVTTNLYVSIEDENEQILKQQLIRVENGITSNTIEIDSSFSTGNYTIKAYTSWMCNFNEQNHFVETIRIIDPKIEEPIEHNHRNTSIDAQFLPESGHLLHNVENTLGVVIKDHKGYGIQYIKGEVIDENNQVITTFETNRLGIGKFSLITNADTDYRVKIKKADKNFNFKLNQDIHKNGVILSVKRLQSNVFVSVTTNDNTLESLKNKRYTLMVHNGDAYEAIAINFTDTTTIIKVIDTNNSPKGINILTLFNENNKPIAERLFFNYQDIGVIKSNDVTVLKSRDSLSVKLNFKDSDTNIYGAMSVSVLPEETKSYNRAHNIMSYTLLKPYVKGKVEQAKYYFTDIDAKKQYELDNLLITQGWSSYNWGTVFNPTTHQTYPFEQGIKIKANINPNDRNTSTDLSYVMHAVNDQEPRFFEIKKGGTNFLIENVFPDSTSTIYLSKITKSDGLLPAKLYLQFFPTKIPPLLNNTVLLEPKLDYKSIEKFADYSNNMSFNTSNKVQNLDEVTVTSRVPLKRQRQNKLSRGRLGKISVVDEQDENSFLTLWRFLIYKAWILLPPTAYGPEGPRTRINSTENRGGPNSVNFYLNDVLLIDVEVLDPIFLSEVDFVEINRYGVGNGMRSPNGFIKIYTHKSPKRRYPKTTTKAYKLPLTFSEQKKFYIPEYKYYNDDFYRFYGTLDWKPNLKIDEEGSISFKIAKPEIPIRLFIEGITENGQFISEDKLISSHISE